MKTNVLQAAESAAGGVIATALMNQGMKYTSRLPPALQPPETFQDPGKYLADKAENLFKLRMPDKVYNSLAKATHFGYGAIWPALLGLIISQSSLRTVKDAVKVGALLGTGVWAISYGVALPATHLSKPLPRQGLTHTASALATHVAWGIAAMLTVVAIKRMLKKW